MMRKVIILILPAVCLISLILLTFATAQDAGIFSGVTTDFKFGEYIKFQAKIESPSLVKELFLFIQPEGQNTLLEKITPDSDGNIVLNYDLQKNPLRPFARINYWFRGSTTDGQDLVSSMYWFNYEDNRFTWQTLQDNDFQVHWIQGDIAFGQVILNIAQTSLKSTQTYLPSNPLENPIKIYVYPTTSDVQSAAQITQLTWVAGHTSPDLGIILISAPSGPSQRLEMERQIPHELMHILEYQMTGSSYQRVPVWLLEGMASMAELYPNPDYQRTLTKATQSGDLLPMTSLCGSFPQDASGAFLAYAQSDSFVRFIYQKYGSSGLTALLKQYKDGVGCEEGCDNALKASLNQLDYRWRQEYLGLNSNSLVVEKLSPYLLLLLLLLAPPLVIATILVTKKTKLPQQ